MVLLTFMWYKFAFQVINCNINVFFIYTCNDNENGDNDDIINRIFISIYILFIHEQSCA